MWRGARRQPEPPRADVPTCLAPRSSSNAGHQEAALSTSFAVFERSLSRSKPPAGLSAALAALWWASKGDWDTAHGIVMDDDGKDCAWVHAYLHRAESDLSNARYWYNRAGKQASTGALEVELRAITTALLGGRPGRRRPSP